MTAPKADTSSFSILCSIDPGIRDVVRALWKLGVSTTDSGDGRSKPDYARALDCEHVVIKVESPLQLAEVLERALRVLSGVRSGEQWQIDYTRSWTLQGEETQSTLIAYRLKEKASEGD